MRRRATSISRTTPRAHGITSVVRIALTPTSWQIAMRTAFTPVVSALVELGQIADPHHLRDFGIPAVNLGIAFERGHEAEADRFDDRIDEIGDTRLFQRVECRLEGLESSSEVGNRDDLGAGSAQVVHYFFAVGPVDTQHQLGAGAYRPPNFVGVEGIDAYPPARGSEIPHYLFKRRECKSRSAADVDDVRP